MDAEYAESKYEPKPVPVPMTLTKIAPKPVAATKTDPNRQIVVIQRPGGATQQIRIAGTSNSPSNGPIKLIKTADGKFLRISSTKKPTVQQPAPNSSVQVKRIVSKNNAGQLVAQSTTNSSPTPTGVKRTFTVAQAQQMGLISSSKLKELVSQGSAQKYVKLNAPQSPDTKPTTTITPTSKVATQKVIIQTSTGEQKQVSLPPNLIKLAQSGQIKAVNVAGKGIQYVRVVGSNSGNTPSSTTTTTVASATKPAQQVATKVQSASKVFVHNKGVSSNQNAKLSVAPASRPQTVGLAIGSNIAKSNVSVEMERERNSFWSKKSTFRIRQRLRTHPLHSRPPRGLLFRSRRKQRQQHQQHKMTLPIARISFWSPNPNLSKSKVAVSRPQKRKPLPSKRRKMMKLPWEIHSHPMKVSALHITRCGLSLGFESFNGSRFRVVSGIRRKHCNCNKSMCLKLYCDCFANGEFCYNCNCKECFNNLENEEERQRAIRICLERNPAAFKWVYNFCFQFSTVEQSSRTIFLGQRSEKRAINWTVPIENTPKDATASALDALKTTANVTKPKSHVRTIASVLVSWNRISLPLSLSDHPNNRFPIGCRNIDMDESMYENNTSGKLNNSFDKSFDERKTTEHRVLREATPPATTVPKRPSCNFMTSDVIEATIQCVIAQAEECQKNKVDSMTAERMILEEFGRCLVEINEFSNKSGPNWRVKYNMRETERRQKEKKTNERESLNGSKVAIGL